MATPQAPTTPATPAPDETQTLRAQLAEHRAAADAWETSRALYKLGVTDDSVHSEAGAVARAAYAALPADGRPSLADWMATRPRALSGYLSAPAAPAQAPAAPPPLGGAAQGAAPAVPAAAPPAAPLPVGGPVTAADHLAAQQAAARGDYGPLKRLAEQTRKVQIG